MTLSDQDARYMLIELLTAPTARDEQRTIGASNLSNGCQFCLASNMLGDMRESPSLDRAWGGRVIGTAIHSILEQRAQEPWFKAKHPDALTEYHMALGIIPGYGPVGSTADLVLPGEQHAFDTKGSTNAKLALLLDYLAISRGEEAPYGRQHAVHKAKPLSEAKYAEALEAMAYKVTGYYRQLNLYGLGLNREGMKISRLSILFVSRDDTMWFDNPSQDDYEHPKRKHGTFVLSFDYDEKFALATWQRGLNIWAAIQDGAVAEDFPRHELCYPCSLDVKYDAFEVDREYPSLPDEQIVRGSTSTERSTP